MNFLFGALLIVLILLPGLLFRLSYLSVKYKKADPTSNFIEKLYSSLLISLLLQVPFYLFINALIVDVNENKLYLILINSEKAINTDSVNSAEILLFFIYTLGVCALAVLFGWLVRKWVLMRKWDIQYPFLKIYSDWYDYLEGRILDYPDQPGSSEKVLEKWLDILVENKDAAYIYSGMLREFVLSENDKLERVYLTGVMRRKLESDRVADKDEGSSSQDHYYYMPGDFFMIPGDKILNINITYYLAEIENRVDENKESSVVLGGG
jgi:hypothetical protein